MAPDNRLMAAEVNGQGADFEVGAAHPLFEIEPGDRYDVTGDGQRFLVNVRGGQTNSEPLRRPQLDGGTQKEVVSFR